MSLNGAAVNHIPAWRRLGLSLKSANPGRDEHTTSKPDEDISRRPLKSSAGNANGYHDDNRTSGSAWTTKRKRESSENLQTEVKKPKLAQSSAPSAARDAYAKSNPLSESAKANGSYAAEIEDGLKQSALRGLLSDPISPKKRKSVSFTVETKNDDGDATNDSLQQAEEVDQELVASAEQLASEADAQLKKAKAKGKGRRQGSTVPANVTEDQPIPPYLEYLRQYRDDRINWKFNKVKQTQLLANAFSIRKVPAEYDDALVEYVKTLQGAAAKQRLSDAGKDVKAELEKSNASEDETQSELKGSDTPDDERRAQDAALERHVQKQKERRRAEEHDEEHENKVIKRRRTERILQLLESNPLPTPNPSFSSPPTANGSHIQFNESTAQPTSRLNSIAGKAKRKRKLRTGVPDDDDSSSSSSSSSSEDVSESDSSSSESESQSDNDSSDLDSDSDSDSDSSSSGSATATTTSEASTSDDDSSDGGSSDGSNSEGSDDDSESS